MSIKRSNKSNNLLRLLTIFSVALSVLGYVGLGWLFYSTKQARLEEKIPSRQIPITMDGKVCEMITPEIRINLSWPVRIALGKTGSITVELMADENIQWICPDLINFLDVLVESRLEIPDSSLHPANQLIQKFSQATPQKFLWSVDFHKESASDLSSFWLNLIVRKSEAVSDRNNSIIDIENWSLFTKNLPISILSIAGFQSKSVFETAISMTWLGQVLFLIALIRYQKKKLIKIYGIMQ